VADLQEVEVGLWIDGAWVEAGPDALVRDPIQINRGRAKWSSSVEPSRASFTLANRDGDWSPDNPTGPFAGLLKRNTPVRVGVRGGLRHLRPTGNGANLASTPDVLGTGGGTPATPVVASTTQTSSSGYVTTQVINLPATLAAGDRLLLVAAFGHSSAVPTGDLNPWTLVYAANLHGFHRWVVYERPIEDATTAAGLANTTVAFTSTTACRFSAQVVRVTGARAGGSGTTWAASAGTGTNFGTSPNSPALTAPWGATTNLFLSLFTAGSDGATVTANPAGFTAVASGVAGAGVIVGSARKASTSATDDPGAFTISTSENWDALTVAFQPVESTSTDGVLDISGDLDARIEFELERDLVDILAGGRRVRLAHKSSGADGWEWALYRVGTVTVSSFTWRTPAGVSTSVTTEQTGSELPITTESGRTALRVTLDVDNGASGRTARFYVSGTIGGTWIQVGADIVIAGTTSIKTNDARLRVGGNPGDVIHDPFPGRLYAFQLRSGINGTVVANPVFTGLAEGATGFTDSVGRVWTIGAGGRVTSTRWRFHGELASMPVRWNVDGSDVWAPFEATGLFRRLKQGNRLIESAIRRAITRSAAGLVQYWPMEEQGGGYITSFGPAVGSALITTAGAVPDTGANTDFLSSAPLPTLGATSLSAFVDTYTATGAWQVRWLQSIPSDFTGTGLHFWRVETTDMVWEVSYRDASGGQFRIHAYRGFTVVWESPWIAFAANGRAWRMTFSAKQNGSNIDVTLIGQYQDGTAPGNVFTAAVAGSAGRVNRLRVNKDSDVGGWAFGHITVQDVVTSSTELATELNAHVGETAGARIARLCAEEGITTRIIGDVSTTEPMGPQRPGTLMDLLQECADTDLGILYEPMETVAVGYRCRTAMVGQGATVALDYSAGEVAAPLELDRDDLDFANDVTVENWSGTTARVVLEDGPLGVAEPPTGAGRYDAAYEVNGLDARLQALAETRLALSTVDEPRVSSLKVAFHHSPVASDGPLTESLLGADLGDLVTVDNVLPVALGATQVRLLIQGTREVIGTIEHTVDMLTSPASPWGEGGDVAPPPAQHTVTFRTQQALATPGQPAHVLTALGYESGEKITRADLDGILNNWLASTGGTLRTVTSAATWTTAMAAAQPGDLIRVTSSFSTAGQLQARGNLYGIGGSNLTANPAGGLPGLPIVVTCANGVTVTGTNLTSGVPVLDLVNCRHVWAVGFNVGGPMQFGIRAMNWGGSSGFPAYIAYSSVHEVRDAAISCQGWFQLIASSGGTPPAGTGNEHGFSEWFVVEENDITNPNPTNVTGNPGEGVYLGKGAAPGWISYAKDCWVRGNRVHNYKANAFEAKPGCHRVWFTDNLAVAGRGSNGAAFELCYQFSGVASRPAWMNNLDGAGSPDVRIYVEGNRVYDYNITETGGASRNQAFLLGMAGVRIANNILWSARDSSYVNVTNLRAVLIQTEKTLADFGDTSTVPTWVVGNNWQCSGLSNPGAGGVPIAGVVFRNNIVPTGYANGTHTADGSDYIAPTPVPGVLDVAEWETYGPGSAFDLNPGSDLVGAGTSIADLDLAIDADISGRPIPSTPNPGPFQPF
jgi:hypothetical protein